MSESLIQIILDLECKYDTKETRVMLKFNPMF